MSSTPIFVTFAMPEESQDFRKALGGESRGNLRVAHFGVGPAMAAKRLNTLLSGPKPQLLICAGFAGGLDPKLRTGDLVLAENLSSPEVVERVRAAVAADATPCIYGSMISRVLPVESSDDKAALFRETGALAVDMESESVAKACWEAGVPLLVVRTISDPAGDSLPVPFADWFDLEGQRPRILGLLKFLALHPSRIAPFAGFVRGLAPARQSLTRFLLGLDFIAEHLTP